MHPEALEIMLTYKLTSNYTAIIDPTTGCGVVVVYYRADDDLPNLFPTPADDVCGIPGAVGTMTLGQAEHEEAMTRLWDLGFKYAEDYDGGDIEAAPLLSGDWSAYAITPIDPADLIGDVIGPEHRASWQALDDAAYEMFLEAVLA